MEITGAEMVWEALLKEKVPVVWGYPGGTILPTYGKLHLYSKKIHHVLVRHEQAAGHAADGYARVTGKPGVAIVTSGPAATNIVTAIATAYLDSVPMVIICGQVALKDIGTDAFQEVDITGITIPITKHNYLVDSIEDLPRVLKEAFYVAQHGRPGPVLVDIPKDIQNTKGKFNYDAIKLDIPGFKPTIEGHSLQIQKAIELVSHAKKPLLLIGRGVLIADAQKELITLAEKIDTPVVPTFLGLSAFPDNHPLYAGYAGMHGFLYTNLAIQEADLLISVGMRFDDRFTGTPNTFAPHAKKIHIDIDPAEINKIIQVDVPIVGDAKQILTLLAKSVTKKTHAPWKAHLAAMEKAHPIEYKKTTSYKKTGKTGRMNAPYVISELREHTPANTHIVTDVGQHQMWVAQHYHFNVFNTHFSSGGLGTMGYALPASMGVKAAAPNKEVWTLVGDGGIMMTVQELATIAQENLDINIMIFNNGYLGMVRQWQDLFYNKVYQQTPLFNPDFIALASAFGIPAIKVTKPSELAPAIEKARKTKGPFVLEVVTEAEENVFPMVIAGASLSDTRTS